MIKAEIFDQKIRLNTESVASDSVKFLKIQFLLDENWDTAFKTAVFKNEELDISASVIMEEENELYLGDNICIIPFEVIKPPCFSVSLSGIKGETVITTIPSEIKVYKSGDISADEPESYTPSQYEQLVDIYNETKSIAESVRKDADNGAFNGKDAVTEQNYNPKSENAQSGKAVSEAVSGLNGVFAPIIKPNMSGRAIKINDASPTEHELKITANYFKLDKVTEQDNEKGKIVINSDKSLEITCKSSEYIILGKLTTLCPNIKGGDVFTLSYSVDGTNNSLGLQIGNADYYVEEKRICSADTYNNYNVNAVLPQDISNVYMFYFSDMTTKTLSNIALFKGIVDDITDVTVSRYGKNLFDINCITSVSGAIDFSLNENELSFTKMNGASTSCSVYGLMFLNKGTYLVSGSGYSSLNGNYGFSILDIQSNAFIVNESANKFRTISFTVAESKVYRVYIYGAYASPSGEKYTIKNIQFEVGESRTEYKPYIAPQTATADADGVVKGLTSISPDMTLIADKDIVLECEYNADTKMYIDNKLREIKMLI